MRNEDKKMKELFKLAEGDAWAFRIWAKEVSERIDSLCAEVAHLRGQNVSPQERGDPPTPPPARSVKGWPV